MTQVLVLAGAILLGCWLARGACDCNERKGSAIRPAEAEGSNQPQDEAVYIGGGPIVRCPSTASDRSRAPG